MTNIKIFKRCSYGKPNTKLREREYVRAAYSSAVGSLTDIVEVFRKTDPTTDFKFEDRECTLYVVGQDVIIDIQEKRTIKTTLELFCRDAVEQEYRTLLKEVRLNKDLEDTYGK